MSGSTYMSGEDYYNKLSDYSDEKLLKEYCDEYGLDETDPDNQQRIENERENVINELVSDYVRMMKNTGRFYKNGGKTKHMEEKYARLADDTGKGINEGYVIGDGDTYFESEDNLVKHLRELDYEDADGNSSKNIKSKDDLLEFFYNDEYYYYTEWDAPYEIEQQGYYYTRDGKEIPLANVGLALMGAQMLQQRQAQKRAERGNRSRWEDRGLDYMRPQPQVVYVQQPQATAPQQPEMNYQLMQEFMKQGKFEHGGMAKMGEDAYLGYSLYHSYETLEEAKQVADNWKSKYPDWNVIVTQDDHSKRPYNVLLTLGSKMGKRVYADGGMSGTNVKYKHWSGDIKTGTILRQMPNGSLEVQHGAGNVLVHPHEIIEVYAKGGQIFKSFEDFGKWFMGNSKSYPTGRAWSKEHYNDNDDEDYEVDPRQRHPKHQARNRKYAGGGGVDGAIEVREEEYYDMLEVVPPIYFSDVQIGNTLKGVNGGFAVGEPYSHFTYKPTNQVLASYRAYFKSNGKYYLLGEVVLPKQDTAVVVGSLKPLMRPVTSMSSAFYGIEENNVITEQQINLIKNRLNSGKGVVDEETQYILDYISENNPELTPEQNEKGYKFLLAVSKKKNSPMGERERDALANFESFALTGFQNAGKYNQQFFVPSYNVLTKDGYGFEYYYAGDMKIIAEEGTLIGDQYKIDMNKNGRIDAEDFKILRSTMNGAWRNEHKHVNHSEDWETKYARRTNSSRTGYKGRKEYGRGGNAETETYIYEDVEEPESRTIIYADELDEFLDEWNDRMETNYADWEDFNAGEDYYRIMPLSKFARGGYPTGRAWTREHYHDNDDEDYEVDPRKRKVKARNRQYAGGGGVEISLPKKFKVDLHNDNFIWEFKKKKINSIEEFADLSPKNDTSWLLDSLDHTPQFNDNGSYTLETDDDDFIIDPKINNKNEITGFFIYIIRRKSQELNYSFVKTKDLNNAIKELQRMEAQYYGK